MMKMKKHNFQKKKKGDKLDNTIVIEIVSFLIKDLEFKY